MNENRITVLHLCEHFGGKDASLHGVARAFQWWLPRFDSSEFRMLLCSRKEHDKAAEQMKKSGLAPQYLSHGKFDPRNLTSLLRLLKREKVDIIHAHGFGACIWARLAGKISNIPAIVHGRANYRKTPLPLRPAERLLGPGTKHALAVSESTKDFMLRHRYIPADSIQVLYNGIPLENIEIISREKRTEQRQTHGATETTIVIGVVGRIVSHKGHLDLLQSVEKMRNDIPGLKVWILGDGDFTPTLKKWITAHKMENDVRFFGFVKNVITTIQCFDIHVFPSHMEGTPNTLFEALAVGNCIVASDTDGQAEILRDEETALVYRSGDVATLERHLREVAGDKTLRDKLSANARNESKTFDGNKTVKFMEDLYRRIIREARAQ